MSIQMIIRSRWNLVQWALGALTVGIVWGTASPANPATTLTLIDTGIYLAASDAGFYNSLEGSLIPLTAAAEQVRKTIDLSLLEDSSWDRIDRAQIALFLSMIGEGDGEAPLEIVLNGNVHHSTLPVVKRYSGQQLHWTYVTIPPGELIKGANEIIVRIPQPEAEGTQMLRIGIDTWEAGGGTAQSTDSGETWVTSPLNRFGHDGEAMIRLVLFTSEAPKGADPAKIGGDPPIPPFDLNPSVKGIDAPARQKQPKLVAGPTKDRFENSWMRVEVDASEGLVLTKLLHKPMGLNGLRHGQGSPLFTLEVEGQLFTSRDFEVIKRLISADAPTLKRVRYHTRNLDVALDVIVEVEVDPSARIAVECSVVNISNSLRLIKVAFPILTGIQWSDTADQNYFLYPYRSGVILNRPAEFLNAYGGGSTYFQMMAAYSPAHGGGLYIRPDDRGGEYKLLHLRHSEKPGDRPSFAFRELMVDILQQRVTPELLLLEPLEKGAGTSLGISYQGKWLGPGKSWELPTAIVGLFVGDWHAAMDAYSKWYNAFTYRRPFPSLLAGRFNLNEISAANQYHGDEGYITNRTVQGHIPFTDDAERIAAYAARTPDILEHSGYWEWDEVTNGYLEAAAEIVKPYGDTFQLLPEHHGVVENSTWNWAQPGDYANSTMNDRWGGLSTLWDYIDAVKENGYLATLLVYGTVVGATTRIGQEYGPNGCIRLRDGRFSLGSGIWTMCVDNPDWRMYLASVCGRLINDTDAKGIRLSGMGVTSFVCHNPAHDHTYAEPGHYAALQAQAAAVRSVRQAMDSVDRSAVVMIEEPGFDVLWQYADGATSKDFASSPFTNGRALDWEGFVGLSLPRFYFPRIKFYEKLNGVETSHWRFFNALGAGELETGYLDRELLILKENAGAYGSTHVKTMVPTLIPKVYVNTFEEHRTIIYHIYNANHAEAEGNLLELDDNSSRYHFVDLIRGTGVVPQEDQERVFLPIKTPAKTVDCIVRLPRILALETEGEGKEEVRIRFEERTHEGELLLVEPSAGRVVHRQSIEDRVVTLDLPEDVPRETPLLIKLHRDESLVDALSVTLPGNAAD